MKQRDASYNILFFLLVVASLSFLLLVNLGDDVPRIIDAMLEIGHIPLFGTVSIALLWILNNRKWPVYTFKYYVLSFIFTVFLGIISEVLQQILTLDRSFGISDIVHDTLGAFTFLVLFHPHPAGPRRRVMTYRLLSVLAMALVSVPMLLTVVDAWNMKRSMPVLDSFESRLEMERLSGSYESLSRSQMHATEGIYSLEMNLSPGTYPGVSFNHISRDWRDYDRLSFDTFLEGTNVLPITIRINDITHNNAYDDRFNKLYTLRPGSNRIVISLGEVRKAPRTRTMEMNRIANICIFSYQLKEPRTLFLDNLRLEKISTRTK